MTLKKIQKVHFDKMDEAELREAIRDSHQQMGFIACSGTKAAVAKRNELEAGIEYCAHCLDMLAARGKLD